MSFFKVGAEDVLVSDRDASGVLITFTAVDDTGSVVGRLNRNVFRAINSASHVARATAKTPRCSTCNSEPAGDQGDGNLALSGSRGDCYRREVSRNWGAISPPACRSGAAVNSQSSSGGG